MQPTASGLDALDHGRIEVDFHWPTHRLIVETDGEESHGTRTAFRDDRRRDAALAAAGQRVVRFTWADVTQDTQRVTRRLRALLEE
jgi:very-short-patch-repair endonuclease